jgi:serine/threonine protein kinase
MDPASWDRAKEILTNALKLPPSERETFVRDRCGDDPTICNEILALLSQYEPTASFFERPTLPDERDELEDLRPGVAIGPYVIVDRLGRGGMGQVFLGRDHALHRKVALKCLLSTRADVDAGSARARILQEAVAAAAINHANVATVHHIVEHDGRAFIVMEYVEGETLATKLRRERLPIARIVNIGRQLAAALHAAHAQDVIHGDLKPSNILITPAATVKVVDFGVSRVIRLLTSVSSSTLPTNRSPAQMGLAVGGTPPYMSPEQLLGQTVDARSDIYSLGVVLFEMATGRRPFPGGNPVALAEAQAKGAPRADSVDARVPALLADAIARALETSKSARFQSALEMDATLQAVEQTIATAPRAPHKLVRSWRSLVAMGPALILALGAIGFIVTTGFNTTFGRTGVYARFGVEPWMSYFTWGFRAVVTSLAIMSLTAILVVTTRFFLQTLELIGPLGRLVRSVRVRSQKLSLVMGLDKPNMLAQTLACLAAATLVALVICARPVIVAWMSFFSTAPIEVLLPIGESTLPRLYYNVTLDVAMLAFGYGLFRVVQLRKRNISREGTFALSILTGVIVVMALMRYLPHRTFSHRDFERVDFAGTRCYVIGQSADEFLLLCPGSAPPRNRAVRRDDPDLHRSGVVENLFRGVNQPRSNP